MNNLEKIHGKQTIHTDKYWEPIAREEVNGLLDSLDDLDEQAKEKIKQRSLGHYEIMW